MSKYKKFLIKLFRRSIEQIITTAVEEAVNELIEEINASEDFKEQEERAILKSGVIIVKNRVLLIIRDKL